MVRDLRTYNNSSNTKLTCFLGELFKKSSGFLGSFSNQLWFGLLFVAPILLVNQVEHISVLL
eukprot:UN03092